MYTQEFNLLIKALRLDIHNPQKQALLQIQLHSNFKQS